MLGLLNGGDRRPGRGASRPPRRSSRSRSAATTSGSQRDAELLRPSSQSACQSSIDAGAAIAASQEFRDDVAAVIAAINRTEPDAKVIVAGYPLLFHLNASGVNPKYAWADEVNAETVVLNDVIESVAVANGAVFVDVEDDFAGHGIGSASPWINDVK